jgi:hypothetical protein
MEKYSHKVVMSTVTILLRNGTSSSKFHTFIEMEPSFLFPFFLFHSYIFQCAFSKLTGLRVEGGKRIGKISQAWRMPWHVYFVIRWLESLQGTAVDEVQSSEVDGLD